MLKALSENAWIEELSVMEAFTSEEDSLKLLRALETNTSI